MRPKPALRHRARPAGSPGYPRVGLGPLVEEVLGLSPGEGALRRRLVHPAAARAVAALRRARRRGARRAARRPRRGARRAGQARVGRGGVRGDRSPPPGRRPGSTRGAAPPACTGSAAPRSWPSCARCGRPATRWPSSATSPPAGVLPDAAIVEAALAKPRRSTAAAHGVPGFTGRGARRTGRPLAGGARRRRAPCPEAELPPPRLPTDAPPPARAWADRDPAAAARLGRGPHRGRRDRRRAPACRWRTCWPPTPSAGCAGRRRTTSTRTSSPRSSRGHGARPWQLDAHRAGARRGPAPAARAPARRDRRRLVTPAARLERVGLARAARSPAGDLRSAARTPRRAGRTPTPLDGIRASTPATPRPTTTPGCLAVLLETGEVDRRRRLEGRPGPGRRRRDRLRPRRAVPRPGPGHRAGRPAHRVGRSTSPGVTPASSPRCSPTTCPPAGRWSATASSWSHADAPRRLVRVPGRDGRTVGATALVTGE